MSRHQEIERKFDVDPAAPFPDLSGANGAVSEAVESDLDATYFDTADAQLARHQITLRRRTGGNDAGWHLKLPAGHDERTEIRLPLGRATRSAPAALVREVRALVRDRPLVPVAKVHTTRVERQLLDRDGTPLATLADDTVQAERLTGDAVEVSGWREVEVELMEGDRSFLDAVARRIQAAGLTPSSSSSKLVRVLGDLAFPAPATTSGRVEAGLKAGRPTAGAVLLAHLHEQVDQLVLCDREARADAAGGVHRMRVAARRLRSALAAYRPLLDPARTDPVGLELKWLGQVLGRSRDTDVLHRRLRDLVAAQPPELVVGPVRRRVDQELRARHKGARAELLAALDGDRYFRLLDALDDLLADPPFTISARKPALKQLPPQIGRAARRVDRAAEAVARTATTGAGDGELLHEVRKSAKRARYAAESAAVVAGKPAWRLARRMKVLQDVLGEHQDSVAARAILIELAATANLAGENTFTYGLLHAQEDVRSKDARRAYRHALRKAATRKTRRWTR